MKIIKLLALMNHTITSAMSIEKTGDFDFNVHFNHNGFYRRSPFPIAHISTLTVA